MTKNRSKEIQDSHKMTVMLYVKNYLRTKLNLPDNKNPLSSEAGDQDLLLYVSIDH